MSIVKKSRRKTFTLVEVVVVIAIMIVTGAIAVSTMRSDSTERIIRSATNDFRSLCSRVRFKAMEMGQDRMVVYVPEERMFYMARPVANMEEALEYEYGFVILKTAKWELPKEFELATDENDPIEVFRFYPDGGASGRWKLTLAFADRDRAVVIEVAKLTGSVIAYDRKAGEQ